MLKISPIMTKARTRMGFLIVMSEATDYEAEIEVGKSITVRKIAGYNAGVERTFAVGDTAEYDSFNLSYLGVITKITEKSVTIQPSHDRKARRLSIEVFAWRNYKFDLDEISKNNHNMMMTI